MSFGSRTRESSLMVDMSSSPTSRSSRGELVSVTINRIAMCIGTLAPMPNELPASSGRVFSRTWPVPARGSTLHELLMVETSGPIFASRTAEGATDLRILEDIPLAVTVHDASGELVFANDAATRDLGIARPAEDPAAVPTFEVFDESGAILPPERPP